MVVAEALGRPVTHAAVAVDVALGLDARAEADTQVLDRAISRDERGEVVLLQGREHGGEVLAVLDRQRRSVELRGDIHRRPLEALLVDDDRGSDAGRGQPVNDEVEQPVGDVRIEIGRPLVQTRDERGGGGPVAPVLTVPRHNPAVGEQPDLTEHQGALHDARPGHLLQADQLGLVLHGPPEAREQGLIVVAIDDERGTAVGERPRPSPGADRRAAPGRQARRLP